MMRLGLGLRSLSLSLPPSLFSSSSIPPSMASYCGTKAGPKTPRTTITYFSTGHHFPNNPTNAPEVGFVGLSLALTWLGVQYTSELIIVVTAMGYTDLFEANRASLRASLRAGSQISSPKPHG